MSMRILILAVLFCAVAAAQGSGVIFGTVTDTSGAAVASVTVTVTNEATGSSENVKSNEQGYYLFPDLRAGRYRITAEIQASGLPRRPEFCCKSISAPGWTWPCKSARSRKWWPWKPP